MLEWLKQHCPNLIPIEDKLGVDFATVCEALDVGYQIQTGCVIIRQMFPWLLVRIQDISIFFANLLARCFKGYVCIG